VILEFSGSSSGLQDGLGGLDVQGVAVLAGAVAADAPVAFDPEGVVRRQLSILEPRYSIAIVTERNETVSLVS
jgi:threonine dehydrogenase-like Zn-dependent dehydrogenase